jgi:hypothetical protein
LVRVVEAWRPPPALPVTTLVLISLRCRRKRQICVVDYGRCNAFAVLQQIKEQAQDFIHRILHALISVYVGETAGGAKAIFSLISAGGSSGTRIRVAIVLRNGAAGK